VIALEHRPIREFILSVSVARIRLKVDPQPFQMNLLHRMNSTVGTIVDQDRLLNRQKQGCFSLVFQACAVALELDAHRYPSPVSGRFVDN
jgi:hypothetical protein